MCVRVRVCVWGERVCVCVCMDFFHFHSWLRAAAAAAAVAVVFVQELCFVKFVSLYAGRGKALTISCLSRLYLLDNPSLS